MCHYFHDGYQRHFFLARISSMLTLASLAVVHSNRTICSHELKVNRNTTLLKQLFTLVSVLQRKASTVVMIHSVDMNKNKSGEKPTRFVQRLAPISFAEFKAKHEQALKQRAKKKAGGLVEITWEQKVQDLVRQLEEKAESEKKVNQLMLDIHNKDEQIQSLTQIQEHAEATWQEKLKALEDRLEKDLAAKDQELKLQIQEKDEQIQSLTQIQEHAEATWQEKLKALEDRFEKDLAAKDQELKLQIQEKDEEITSLNQCMEHYKHSLDEKTRQMDKNTEELHKFKAKVQTLEVALSRNLSKLEDTWDTRLKEAKDTISEWKLKLKEAKEDNNVLTQQVHHLEKTVQEMHGELHLLGKICLYQKSKRSIFKPKIQNEEAALERMKTKMRNRVNR